MTMRTLVLILLAAMALCMLSNYADGRCSSRRGIRRVYVIRRNLSFIPHVCQLAHSGLILEMKDGRQCVLEYMGDGRAHLYDARPSSTRNCWFGKRCKVLKMKDDAGTKHTWTRQKYGTAFPRQLGTVIPQAAWRKMQSIMGYRYNLVTNNCHLAQEKLRKYWGMRVSQAYQDPKTLCTCIRLVPYLPPVNSLAVYLNMLKALCRQRG